ncbi:MAG TPA: ATP-binding protein [Nocardioidaceae bacterium]|nr:ATP-binding protein [Nocardioidaceae bacterium]
MPSGSDRAAATVSVTIARDPALVRTVRLVAASVARRTGRDEEFVEEVRLAAGEACALFLGESAGSDLSEQPVSVTISFDEALSVDVSTPALVDVEDHPDSDLEGLEAWALLRGLIADFKVSQDAVSTTVSMRWPLS